MTSNTVTDDEDEHANVGEEDVGDDFPYWLSLLNVELVLFTHIVSVLSQLFMSLFLFSKMSGIFSFLHVSLYHISTPCQ